MNGKGKMTMKIEIDADWDADVKHILEEIWPSQDELVKKALAELEEENDELKELMAKYT